MGVPHRVRRGPLLGEMNDRLRPDFLQHRDQPVVLRRQIQVHEPDGVPGHLLPYADPLAHRADRRQRLNLELDVDLPAAQVVDDGDLVTTIRQVQRRRPATEPITAENHNAHYDSHHGAPSSEKPAAAAAGGTRCRPGWRRASHGVPWRSVYPRETVTTPALTRPELDITTSHLSNAIESHGDASRAGRH